MVTEWLAPVGLVLTGNQQPWNSAVSGVQLSHFGGAMVTAQTGHWELCALRCCWLCVPGYKCNLCKFYWDGLWLSKVWALLQGGGESPDHPMCLRKRESTWFSLLSITTLFLGHCEHTKQLPLQKTTFWKTTLCRTSWGCSPIPGGAIPKAVVEEF